MGSSIANGSGLRHPVLPDIARPTPAKAHVRTPDINWARAIGAAIQQAVKDAKWSNKEAAEKAGVDDAEFGKWLSGARRPQFDRLFAIAELRAPLVLAIAALADGVEIVTEIRLKRA